MNNTREIIRQSKTLVGPFPVFEVNVVPEFPHELFLEWFQVAIENGVHEPHAMTISTIDQNGFPDARVLIVKDVDQDGWYFASSSQSEKGKHMEMNPHVALTFYWPGIGRQVRIRGKAVKMGQDRSANDFLNRGIVARAIALIDKQSLILSDSLELERALEKQMENIKLNPNLVSSTWNLYQVIPSDVEFWQADEERKHIRLKYTVEEGKWLKQRLWP